MHITDLNCRKPGSPTVVYSHERLALRPDRLNAPSLTVPDPDKRIGGEREDDRVDVGHAHSGVTERERRTLSNEFGIVHVGARLHEVRLARPNNANVTHQFSPTSLENNTTVDD